MEGNNNGPRRAATVKDVARAAGVSIASVSRVINGTGPVAQATRRRVTDAIARLHYVPHQGAASLVTRRHGVVGLLLPELHAGMYAKLIRGIEDAARRHGRHLLVCNLTGDAARDAATLTTLTGRVDGLLLMAPHRHEEALAELLPGDVPAVLLNTRADSGRNVLTVDNYGAVMEVMRHLKRCGRRVVAHIAGPAGNHDAEERVRAWRDALATYWPGTEAPFFRGDFEQESGRAAGQAFAASPEPPDAIFAANDLMAAGAMRALADAGLAVPEDVAVVGFDDVPLASLLSPALTTVHVDVESFGRCALERLLRLTGEPALAQERCEPVPSTLVVRESCGSAAAPARARRA
ncbi:MAG TPA: LacI family DNA-binding transcriptional regulator [Woeseiaceae bacterium]